MAKSKLSGIRIDKTSLFIASLAPLLWVIDSYRGALLLNESFVKQLLFPASSEFLLRLWLVFFIFIQAWFFNRYSRATGGEAEVREKFTLLFELAQDVLVITDTEGKVRQASRSAEKFWGYSLEQLLTLDLTLLCPEGEAEKLTGFIRQIARDKTGRLDNVVLSGKDGKQRLSDINARFIDGGPGGNKPGIFLDISERGSGAAVAEPEAPAVAVTPVPPVPVPSAPQVEVPSVDLEQERRKIEEAVRQQEAAKSQQAIKALEQRYLEIMKQRLAEECKKVEESVRQEEKKKTEGLEEAVRRQETVKSQEAIKVLEQRYNQILNARVAEERRQVEELVRQEENKKAEARVRELEAKFSRDSGEQISEGRKLIEEAVRREEQKISEEKTRELERELEQKYTQILNARIEEARHLEQKNSEQQVLESRQRYEELLRGLEKKHAEALKAEAAKASVRKAPDPGQSKPPEISRVVRGISQQMMNPLAAVLNQLKLIKIKFTQGGELKPNEFKDTVDLIEENALLCRSILSSLSDTGQGVKVSFQPVSLNNVISRIDGLMGQELKLQNITVTKQLDPALPEISGDPLLLTQVVFNLLANAKWAIKSNAYGAPGIILIRTHLSSGKDSVSLEITDNGVGISEQDLPRIFEPFFTTRPDCLGLGLFVAENIVKAHQGRIQAESKEGGGATFRVILPTGN